MKLEAHPEFHDVDQAALLTAMEVVENYVKANSTDEPGPPILVDGVYVQPEKQSYVDGRVVRRLVSRDATFSDLRALFDFWLSSFGGSAYIGAQHDRQNRISEAWTKGGILTWDNDDEAPNPPAVDPVDPGLKALLKDCTDKRQSLASQLEAARNTIIQRDAEILLLKGLAAPEGPGSGGPSLP